MTTHPPLEPSLKKEYSYISTPSLGLRDLFYGELYLYLYHVSLFNAELRRPASDEVQIAGDLNARKRQNTPLRAEKRAEVTQEERIHARE